MVLNILEFARPLFKFLVRPSETAESSEAVIQEAASSDGGIDSTDPFFTVRSGSTVKSVSENLDVEFQITPAENAPAENTLEVFTDHVMNQKGFQSAKLDYQCPGSDDCLNGIYISLGSHQYKTIKS